MSDLGIICALFGYLLRLSDDADIMLGYNIICASLEGFHRGFVLHCGHWLR